MNGKGENKGVVYCEMQVRVPTAGMQLLFVCIHTFNNTNNCHHHHHHLGKRK